VPLELPAYQKKENWGASETLYRLVRTILAPHAPKPGSGGTVSARQPRASGSRPRCNLLGATALGFRNRDDITEVTRLLALVGVDVAVVAPYGATVADIAAIPAADFNVVMYPEIASTAAGWLERTFGQPQIRTVPIGIGATRDFLTEVVKVSGLDPAIVDTVMADVTSRLPWYSRSVDSTYLTAKRVFIFGDATHAIAAARIASKEMGFDVVGLGTYSREMAREVREAAKLYGVEALISDDYLAVEAAIAAAQPELVLGTQMERHIAKRLGIACAVISAPIHVQDFPARYAPQMGFEGANVIFDTWVHPLMMGLEEHLLGMFRGDHEFHDGAVASHLGHGARPGSAAPAQVDTEHQQQPSPAIAVTVAAEATPTIPTAPTPAVATNGPIVWAADAEKELGKIPFFVRGKARRNTERFAAERHISTITIETLYDAKAHYSR
jgi:light-independent protochlorophyllide reductase subunit B